MIVDALHYRPTADRFDEAVDPSGAVRANWAGVERALGPLDAGALVERRLLADRMLDAEGAGYLVHDLAEDLALAERTDRHGHEIARRVESHPWRLDPLPFVIDAGEFERLAAAAVQRVRLMEALLADLHGPRALMQSGAVPPAVVAGSPRLRVGACAAPAPRRWLVTYALDVARDAGGQWSVVQDLTGAPSGLGYALLGRSVTARVSGAALRVAGAAPLRDFPRLLRRALTSVAPRGRRSPRCVVLAGGPAHPTYVEHSYLATTLGYHLVEAGDVVMRDGQLWLRAIHGLEPLDVVYRRLDDDLLDPLEPRSAGPRGVPGLAWGQWRGGVAVANAYGAGLAEEPDLGPFLDAAAAQLLAEPLLLPALPPGAPLATSPVLGDGELQPAAAVVRLLAVAGPDGIDVLPGGSARVLAAGDDPRWPSSQLVKDVWVVGGTLPLRLALRPPAPPQVDLSASVSKRAADALYWLGRAAERAEVAARAVRVVSAQLDQDPTIGDGDADVTTALIAIVRAADGLPAGGGATVADELARAIAAVADHVAALVTEAMSVREYLSTMTGRLLGRLMRTRAELLHGGPQADDLDTMLVDLAALSGLATESLVRGPAWRFLDLGRRVERALAVLGGVEATLTTELDAAPFQALSNIELAVNESLVAYRRRHRSDVDLATVFAALVDDDTNPRSFAFQVDRMREHVAALGWPDGSTIVERIASATLTDVAHAERSERRAMIAAFAFTARDQLMELAAAIVTRWFADPVDPRRVRGL